MRKENSDFKTSFLSESGKQLQNKDYFAFVEEEEFACWVMASSIDNSETINSAEIAVKTVLDSFIIKPSIKRKSLAALIKEAHEVLMEESVRDHLQASIMIVVTDYINVRWASAGNVHLQSVHNSRQRFSSKDQSLYQQLLDDGTFPLDRSVGFEERNNLTEYLGKRAHFKPFISEKRKLHDNDTLVLTTVGMWEHITDIELLDALFQAKSAEEVINNLEEMLLSKQPEDLKSYSVAIIMVNKLFVKSKNTWKIVKRVLIIAIPIVIIIGIISFVLYRNSVARAEQIQEVLALEQQGDEFIFEENFDRALDSYDSATAKREDINNYPRELERLDIKNKMTQYLVDGNDSLETDDVETAQKRFEQARNYFVDNKKVLSKLFDQNYITEQLDFCNQKNYVKDLEMLGDTQTEAQQYTDAIDTYQKAKLAAISLSDQRAIEGLNVKLETAQAQQNLADQAAAKSEADQAASQAEQDAANGNTDNLAGKYEDIADMYDNAGFSDKASAMRAKAEELRADEANTNNTQQEQVGIDLETKGDAALVEGHFSLAIQNYQAAQLIYQNIKNDARVSQVQQKIESTIKLRDETAAITANAS